ncbi:hypothetical protein V8B55DRAFT_1507614 [Mucor lusitanicus]|uniref:F-box domain-containing protein n=2 Tax=Mucor circinelloides f. lusitanicus TaxID=29924 RepID=A0A162U0B9_MUCCL|nr:hypothetical protein FB192DRAFT_1369255 [Mucor lusitanicus]OAD08482.1 hypothetical protein MUCCIDRAFT_90025 [Mucor lusitanicus CBS 277.49]
MTEPHLPTELWKQVFACTDKKDLKTCLLVSKSWHYVARSYFSEDIQVNLNDSRLHRLDKDVREHPHLGAKISRITVNHMSTGMATPETFRSVINQCPNLLELEFEITDVYHYLKSLNCKEALLPSIQKIQVRSLLECSPAVRRFHLWVNYRFRATITSIEIMDMKDNAALKDYGGLVTFASCFPQLTSLKAQCNALIEKELNINLTELLKNNDKLQELKLYGIGKITNTLNEISSEATQIEFPSLTKFKLEVSNINIKSLEYITKRFTHLQSLRLLTSSVVPDRSLSESQATSILTDFKAFAMKPKRIHVSYKYKNEHFHENNGKKRPSWITHNFLFLEGLSRQYFMNDFMEDEDDDMDEEDYFEDFDEELAEDLMYSGLYDELEDDDPGFASFFTDYYTL